MMPPKSQVDHSIGVDKSIMTDEEWMSIQAGEPGVSSKKDDAARYAARMSATVDWNNLPEDAARDIKKIFRERADHTIMKQGLVDMGEYFMERPMDVVLD